MILLGNQGWLAREEGPKGSSQDLSDQVLLLAAVERGIVHSIVQVFPEELINMEVALLAYFMLLGKP